MPIILVNQTLSQLLRYVVGKNLEAWEECLPHAEFSYNMVVNSTTYSPFEVVYGSNPLSPLNLLPLPNTFAMMNRDGLSKANFVKSFMRKGKHKLRKGLNNMLDIPIRGKRKWLSNRVIGFGFT